jgi:hypothetical protein
MAKAHLLGEPAVLLAGAAPVRDAEGAITGAIGVFADATFLKELEADLLRRERRAHAEARGPRSDGARS